MANKRISELPAASDLIGSEAFIIDQINSEFITGRQTVNIDLNSVQNYVLSGGSHLEIEGNATIFGDLTVTGVLQFDSLEVVGDIETTEGRYLSADVDLLDIFAPADLEFDSLEVVGDIETTDGRYLSADVDLLDIFQPIAGGITQTITAGNMEIEITDGLITDVNDIVGILGYS